MLFNIPQICCIINSNVEVKLKSEQIISQVGEYLRQALPKDASKLLEHVRGLEALQFDLTKERVDSMQFLYEKRRQLLWPKDIDTKLTELDRTTRLNADVAVLERDHQFLVRLEQLVEARLDLASRLLD